jgi:hypothetical protein
MRHFDSRPSDEPVASAAEQAQSLDDDFEEGSADGVSIDAFDPGTVLAVTTRNSRYRLTLLDREGHALISGGSIFADPTEVRIQGATLRGIIPKFGRILVGHQLELSIGNRLITTSSVQSVQAIAA